MGKIIEPKSGRYISDGSPPKLDVERFAARPETKALARWLAVTRGIEVHELYEGLLIAEDERSRKGDNPETIAHYQAQAEKALRMAMQLTKSLENSVETIKRFGAENDRMRRDYAAALKALKKAKEQLRKGEPVTALDSVPSVVAEAN